MKRIQLIEIAVLVIALICGYQFFNSLVNSAISVVYLGIGRYDSAAFALEYLFFAAIYFGCFIVLVKNGKKVARYIDGQWQPASQEPEEGTINITLYQNNLLFIVLIAVCVITIITEIPSLLIGIYDYFKKESSGASGDLFDYRSHSEDLSFKVAAIRLTVSIIILFYARPISNWLGSLGGPRTLVAAPPNEP